MLVVVVSHGSSSLVSSACGHIVRSTKRKKNYDMVLTLTSRNMRSPTGCISRTSVENGTSKIWWFERTTTKY